MRIIYGVCGEGYGHSSRAKALIEHLKKKGHKILVITYGQGCKALSPLHKTMRIEGICLNYKGSSLSIEKTIRKNFPGVISNIINTPSINRKILSFNPDIAITDFEPMTALFSYKLKIPLICIGNHYLITHEPIKVPKKYYKDYLLTKLAVKTCIPSYDYLIIFSLKKVSSKKNVFFVPPIIRKEILSVKPEEKNYILVYLAKPKKELISLLKQINEKFVVYGSDNAGRDKNIIFKKISSSFIRDLASAKAVIGTAGFSLISEAVYLKKPYFSVPVPHYEQIYNSLMIKKNRFGEFKENPDKKDLEDFLKNLGAYKRNMQKTKLNEKETFHVIDRILKKEENQK